MALKINFKDFKAQFPFRFKAKATKEEANKLLSGIEANIDILPDFEVEEGTELNAAFFKQLEQAINADQQAQDEAFQLAIANIEVPVKSVNDKTGAVELTASDVGAVPTTRKVNNKALSGDITLAKEDVGLGSVQNYGIATTAEAQAGAVNNKYMTPALVKAAVQYLATTGGISMVKSVQRGSLHDISSSNTRLSEYNLPYIDVSISSVNVSKSMVIINSSSKNYDNNMNENGKLINSTTLRLFATDLITSDKGTFQNINWQVVEYM